ncbi:MAG: hypothetical protein HeimC3_24440 [Candidatus Heimdallarchaeota archaeon LC_3]|nr:MAG: hypothetical protein HeimC3_24440 [Candidatus Heimdallarchaeota archaeon LC_3]
MADSKITAYLTIMSLMQQSDNESYYARTKIERKLFTDLLERGLVNRRNNSKYCYVLSSKGIKETTNILKVLSNTSKSTADFSISKIDYIIKNAVLNLITPIRPMVKIPDLWNYLLTEYNENLDRKIFNKHLLQMHSKGDITLQAGFSINETKDGIKTIQGNFYYYIMIDA